MVSGLQLVLAGGNSNRCFLLYKVFQDDVGIFEVYLYIFALYDTVHYDTWFIWMSILHNFQDPIAQIDHWCACQGCSWSFQWVQWLSQLCLWWTAPQWFEIQCQPIKAGRRATWRIGVCCRRSSCRSWLLLDNNYRVIELSVQGSGMHAL